MAKAKTCVITAGGKRVCGRPTTGASGAAARKAAPAARARVSTAVVRDRYDLHLPLISIERPRGGGHRDALILAHRIAADVLEASGTHGWSVSLGDNGSDDVAYVRVETNNGTAAEADAVMAVLTRVAAKHQK